EEEGHSLEQQRTPGGEGLGQQGVEAERLEQFGAEVGIHGGESAEARRAQRLRAAALRCEDFFLPARAFSSSFAAVRFNGGSASSRAIVSAWSRAASAARPARI